MEHVADATDEHFEAEDSAGGLGGGEPKEAEGDSAVTENADGSLDFGVEEADKVSFMAVKPWVRGPGPETKPL